MKPIIIKNANKFQSYIPLHNVSYVFFASNKSKSTDKLIT